MNTELITTGKERQGTIWSGIGKNVEGAGNVKEILEKIGGDYEVSKNHLLRISNEDLENIQRGVSLDKIFRTKDIITTHQATYREDNSSTLGVVGVGYTPVQNIKAFSVIDELLSEHGKQNKIEIQTGGVLDGGKRLFIQAKIGDGIRINGSDDLIDYYCLFLNSHDGSQSISFLFTPYRLACSNMINMVLREAKKSGKLTFKHTRHVEQRMDFSDAEKRKMALQILNAHSVHTKTLQEQLNHLSTIKLTESDVKRIVAQTFLTHEQSIQLIKENYIIERLDIPTRAINKYHDVLNVVESGVGQDMWRGSGLWLFNGITCYQNNAKTYKEKEDRFNNLLEGSSFQKTQQAYELVMEM